MSPKIRNWNVFQKGVEEPANRTMGFYLLLATTGKRRRKGEGEGEREERGGRVGKRKKSVIGLEET